MRNVILLLSVLLFTGCANYAKNASDILNDRISQERIYSSIRNYPELIKINKEKLERRDTPENRIALAQNYYDFKDYHSALYYIEPVALEGRNAKALLLKAQIYNKLDNAEKSLEYVDKALALDPKFSKAYNIRGILQTQNGDFAQARESFLMAKSLFLEDEIINNNLAMLCIAQSHYQEAVDYLLPLYNRGFKDETIISNLVLALVKNGNDSQALAILEKERISRDAKAFIKELKKITNK